MAAMVHRTTHADSNGGTTDFPLIGLIGEAVPQAVAASEYLTAGQIVAITSRRFRHLVTVLGSSLAVFRGCRKFCGQIRCAARTLVPRRLAEPIGQPGRAAATSSERPGGWA